MISIGIADDDALVRNTLEELLSKNSDIHVAWVAGDGQEALDLFRSSETPEIQAILVDVQMPRLDGLALAETLHKEAPDLAILILTTFVADSIVDQAMACGARGFVAKEDSVANLAGAIQQAVEGNLILSPTSSAILTDQFRTRVSGAAAQTPAPAPTGPPAHDAPASPPHGVTLSTRELEVLLLISQAKSNKQIAHSLNLSEATIKTHVSTIIAKLGVQDRVGAAVYALRHGLV